MIELDGTDGAERIEGETLAHSMMIGRGAAAEPGASLMIHGTARFRRNGDEAVGLLERSGVLL